MSEASECANVNENPVFHSSDRSNFKTSSPTMSLKSYFDVKLHAHLCSALSACAAERPADPVLFVANYLLQIAASAETSLENADTVMPDKPSN